ncbi:MAG TPA: hypothetical protein VHX88_00385 [Solirubrobacteraceae bacterium]|nr:hypothetical protein [Solirubrobacteraceae bacterium]
MERRVQLICAWCGPVFLILFMVGYWFVAGLLPPPSANDSAQHIALFYRDHQNQIRAGMTICLCAAPFMVPFVALITYQLIRSNPKLAPFAYTQLACGLFVVMIFTGMTILVSVAAFRPDRSPAVTQGLNDLAWTIFVWPFSFVLGEYVPVALAVLMDTSDDPVYPKWVGWFELAMAALFLPAAPMIFYHSGAFSWEGFWPFWLGFAAFAGWFWVMFAMMLRAINRQPREPAVESTA